MVKTDLARNLALLGISMVLALVLGEYAARFAFSGITTTADNGSYVAL
jgi:hypothetical protein